MMMLCSFSLFFGGCLAYVGPGPALGMLWAIVGLFVTLVLCFSSIVQWPIRALIRRLRRKRATETQEQVTQ